MKKQKRPSQGYRPWCTGLAILLAVGSGCGGTSGVEVSAPSSQQPQVAVGQQTDEGLEELPPEVLARAANVYPATIRQASTNAQGQQATGTSNYASLSVDGKYVAFVSNATNLGVSNPTSQYQVYRKNLDTGEIVAVSRESAWGPAGNGQSAHPRISDDGGKVAFSSRSSNLTYGVNTSPNTMNVYLARFYPSYPGGPTGDFQTQLLTKSTTNSSRVANGDSIVRDFAGDGFLGFRSAATDLSWDDPDNIWDLYFADVTQQNSNVYPELFSRDNYYVKGNQQSLNVGLYSGQPRSGMFITSATNLLGPGATLPGLGVHENYQFRHQSLGGRKVREIEVAEQNPQSFVITSNNAANNGYETYFFSSQYPAPSQYPGDQNYGIKLASATQADDSVDISDNGRFVVYEDLTQRTELGDTDALYDIYLYDAQTARHYLVTKNSPSNTHAYRPTISDDGSTVAWDQGGRVWVTGNPALGASPPSTPQTVSSTQSGVTSNGGWQGVMGPAISADGRYLTFSSDANNLSTEATNSKYYTYRKDLYTGELLLVSRQNGTNQAAESSTSSLISDDGKSVIFESRRTDLGTTFPPASNFYTTYARDILTGTTRFLFHKGRALELNVAPYDPNVQQLWFSAYGTQGGQPFSFPTGLYQTDLMNNYPYSPSGVPSWMTQQYGIERVKATSNGQKLTVLFSDTAANPDVYMLYQFNQGYSYMNQPLLISSNVDFQHFDVSDDGNTVAYTERLAGAMEHRMLRIVRVDQMYNGGQTVGYTQATHPDLSADGRYLLYYDTNMQQGQNQGSGSNAYVYDTQTQVSLPLRQQPVTFPGSLRLSDDGRSVVFEDTDASGNTQLFVVKNPHNVQ